MSEATHAGLTGAGYWIPPYPSTGWSTGCGASSSRANTGRVLRRQPRRSWQPLETALASPRRPGGAVLPRR